MIINFPVDTQVYGEYCPVCHAEGTLSLVKKARRKVFNCSTCNNQSERLIMIDPKIHWWMDAEGVYYHESAGILLVNPDRRLLFFELTKFPYGLTAPAGHVDAGETALAAVMREAKEEVGVDLAAPRLVIETTIHGDSCRRGSDDHVWSLYIEKITQKEAASISVDHREGQKPRWVDIAEIDSMEVPYAMRFLFDNYKKRITEALASL